MATAIGGRPQGAAAQDRSAATSSGIIRTQIGRHKASNGVAQSTDLCRPSPVLLEPPPERLNRKYTLTATNASITMASQPCAEAPPRRLLLTSFTIKSDASLRRNSAKQPWSGTGREHPACPVSVYTRTVWRHLAGQQALPGDQSSHFSQCVSSHQRSLPFVCSQINQVFS